MSFKDIIGQEAPLAIIKSSLKNDRLSHAYLFVGEEGVGKETVAQRLAKILNCQRQSLEACGECSSCKKIERFLHPDVKYLKPEGPSQTIKIDHILKLQHEIYLKAFEGRKKVFIISSAERMTQEAANAFLKTLEEPPGEAVLILITSHPEKLLPTITSRCQLVRFNLISKEKIEKFLREKLGSSKKEAENLSLNCEGRLGEAVKIKKEGILEDKGKILDLILSKGDILSIVEDMVSIWERLKERLKEVYEEELGGKLENLDKKNQKIVEENMKALISKEYRKTIDEGIEAIIFFFRDCLVWGKTGDKDLIRYKSRLKLIKEAALSFSCKDLEKKIQALAEVKKALSYNVHLPLALTAAFLDLGKF